MGGVCLIVHLGSIVAERDTMYSFEQLQNEYQDQQIPRRRKSCQSAFKSARRKRIGTGIKHQNHDDFSSTREAQGHDD